MSERYVGAWEQAGLFNPLTAPTGTPNYTYYLNSWGNGSNGVLGIGNTTYYSSPKQVGSLTTWLTISAGNYVGLSIKTDGTLWAWGSNNSGQLGLGNRTNYSSPKQVGALTNWKSAITANTYSVAIKTDGTLWTWGRNQQGQLGLGNITDYSSPKQVGALTNWLRVGAGAYSVVAVKTDGSLWVWGRNQFGQLGLNNTTNYSSPVQVGALTNWSSVAITTDGSVYSIKTDNSLWVWGYNASYGNLGLGNLTNYSSPKQVGSLTNWSKLASGSGRNVPLIKTDGTLWVWGINSYGQLGLGNRTLYSSPKQVGALTNWLSVSCGQYFTISIKTDGTAWSWGQNTYGQLGLGNVTNYSSPKQVGALTNWSSVSCGYANSFGLTY